MTSMQSQLNRRQLLGGTLAAGLSPFVGEFLPSVFDHRAYGVCDGNSKRDSSQDGDPRSHDYGSYPDHYWSRSRFEICRRY